MEQKKGNIKKCRLCLPQFCLYSLVFVFASKLVFVTVIKSVFEFVIKSVFVFLIKSVFVFDRVKRWKMMQH